MLKKGIPRHSQISRWLRKKINAGDYIPDEKLPSENDLSIRFGVSRVTVRRALQSLENEEVIYRRQGLGSFVNDNRASHSLIRLTDFDEDMAKAGLRASSLVKDFVTIDAPGWLSNLLHLPENVKVIRVDRLRLGNGEPIAYDSTWLPILYGQLLNKQKLHNTTIYKVLEQEYDIPVIRGSYKFSAEPADKSIAKELDVQEHAPLLLMDRTTFTIGNKPVYYQKRYYRSDKVMYEMTLERSKDGRGHSSEMPLKEFIPVFKA
jgi:GntR family transcriptional regulator